MTSSVDPTNEMTAIKARLDALATKSDPAGPLDTGLCYEGVDQGTQLPRDGFGSNLPYRDFEPGSVIPAAGQRLMAGGEQDQPHVWAFQIHHTAKSRALAVRLSIESDKSLIGWAPTTDAGPITTFFFTVYDEFNKQGERTGVTATRFYETTLGQNPDFNGIDAPDTGFGIGGYGE